MKIFLKHFTSINKILKIKTMYERPLSLGEVPLAHLHSAHVGLRCLPGGVQVCGSAWAAAVWAVPGGSGVRLGGVAAN